MAKDLAYYLKRAEELAVKNPETLGWNDLRSAVSKAEAELAKSEKTDETKKAPESQENEDSKNTTPNSSSPEGRDYSKLIFELDGTQYTFSIKTPNPLRFQGKLSKLEDLIKNKKAMQALIVGQSPFVIQKH